MKYNNKSFQFTDDRDKKLPLRDALKVEIELSDHLRKMSRNVLFCLLASTAIVVMGFEPTKLSWVGVDFESEGAWPVPWAVGVLAIVFAGLGFESWQDARNSFSARIKLRTDEIATIKHGIYDAIARHYTFGEASQKGKNLSKFMGTEAPVSTQIDTIAATFSELKLSDTDIESFRTYAKPFIQQEEDLDAAVKRWPRWQWVVRTVHIIIPATAPFLCLILAVWDSWAQNAPPEPASWCIGQYESLIAPPDGQTKETLRRKP